LQASLQRGCKSTPAFKNSERNNASLESRKNRPYTKTSDFVVKPRKNFVQNQLSASDPKSPQKQK
jgi:hypothetical protein